MQDSEKGEPTRRTALITGGSKGIGFELARQFAQHGHDLVLVARGKEALDAAGRALSGRYGCSVVTLGMDLADDAAPVELYRRIRARGIRIDVLVNNAGIAEYGAFSNSDPQRLSAMLGLNVIAPSLLIRQFLPGMIERGEGRIVNVASVVAFFAGASNWAGYAASKQYVLALTRGLRDELRGTGVSVTALCPGPAATAFADHSGVGASRAYRWLPKVHPSAVARAGYRGTMAGRAVVVPGLFNGINAFLGELPPRAVAQAVLSFLLRPARSATGTKGAGADEVD